ncbi:MAG: nickel pincer cofactor biosynthesis protein LarC [Lachnospiraceae bacterium]|nr:nickel pincer cofactor biosynthesis protein LarC [Lachnospiraceae bacterium]
MNTLYIECNMGAAGDMLTAALYELLSDTDKKRYLEQLKKANIPDVEMTMEASEKCGIKGTHFSVRVNGEEEESDDYHHEHHHAGHDHEHDHGPHEHHDHGHIHEHDDHDHEHGHMHGHGEYDHDHGHMHGDDHGHEHTHNGHDHHHVHRGMKDIEDIVNGLDLDPDVKRMVLEVYKIIAAAEGKVHGKDAAMIHFHEVGAMDAIADITACCLAMSMLDPEKVVVSPVHVGSGQVRCAHGIMPVPAPATAEILKGVPVYGGNIEGELCTPTGAALLKYFATEYGNMPVMSIENTGYGMGKKDFAAANCVRILSGNTEGNRDTVTGLSCNVDDMTGEEIGYAYDKLFEAGALEVYTYPVSMKKSRQGIVINVLCREDRREDIVKALFKHTTTIGIRQLCYDRYILDREVKEEELDGMIIRRKDSFGYGVKRSKYEFDDLAKLADAKNISLREAAELMKQTLSEKG